MVSEPSSMFRAAPKNFWAYAGRWLHAPESTLPLAGAMAVERVPGG